MFTLTLTYKNNCNAQTLSPIWRDLICGKSYDDMIQNHGWSNVDCAILEMAIYNGWNIEKAMKSEEIEELLDSVINTNTYIECIRDQLVKKASSYLHAYNILRETLYA